jgi:hypothetical protein
MRHVMEEESTHPTEKRSINSRYGATQERPFLISIVRDSWVRMLEIRDHDDPVIGELQSLSE